MQYQQNDHQKNASRCRNYVSLFFFQYFSQKKRDFQDVTLLVGMEFIIYFHDSFNQFGKNERIGTAVYFVVGIFDFFSLSGVSKNSTEMSYFCARSTVRQASSLGKFVGYNVLLTTEFLYLLRRCFLCRYFFPGSSYPVHSIGRCFCVLVLSIRQSFLPRALYNVYRKTFIPTIYKTFFSTAFFLTACFL